MWTIEQVTTAEQFENYRESVTDLLGLYYPILMDASCGNDLSVLIENLSVSLPYVWLLLGPDPQTVQIKESKQGEYYSSSNAMSALGLVSLTDIVINRHAFLHGVSHPYIHQNSFTHSLIAQTAFTAIAYAFKCLRVLKVKAEFESDNLGAKGFCLRMGFHKEGHFKQDNLVNNQLKDVLIYSLSLDRAVKLVSTLDEYLNRSNIKGEHDGIRP